MADNAISLKIGTDLSELERDSKKLGSALEGAARGGIAGFEAAQQRVIDLRKSIGQLRDELLKTQDPASVTRLNAALKGQSAELRAASMNLKAMGMESREANEKAQMLAATLGIRIPQGLGVILARLPALQAAMSLAFSATIVLAIGAAIVAVIPKLDEWIDKLRGIEEANADVFSEVAKVNEALGAFGKPDTTKALRAQINGVAAAIHQVKGQIDALQTLPEGKPGAGAFSPAMWYINRKEIAEFEKQLVNLQAEEKKLGTAIPVAEIKEHTEAIKKETERLAKELLHQADFLYTHWEGLLDLQKRAMDAEQAANETIGRGRHDLAVTTIKDEEEIIRTMEEHGRVMDERIIRQSKEAAQATQDAARAQQQTLEATAGKIESFIDRVFLTARSLSDVFHQFLMQLLGSFVRWASQMLAHWLTGIRQVTAGAGGGGGGLLGGLLGGLFGIGGGTPALAATGGGTSILAATSGATGGQMALPVGMGGMALSGGGGIPSAVGGAAQGGLGYAAFHPGQLAANLATLGPALAVLGGVGLMGRGGPITGAIGGVMTAVGVGLLVGGLPGLLIAGVAAGIGALIGAARRGRQKRKSAALEQGFEFAADDVLKQYELHKVDYENAISSLEGLMASGQQTLLGAGTGRWGRQGSENLTRVIQNLIARVNDLEKQRQATTTTLAGMTIPEFAVGGVVGLATFNSRLSTGLLAILHPGEFVMQQRAVDALGVNFLAALNRAPRFDTGGPVSPSHVVPHGGIHIHGNLILYPEKGMSKREAMQMVVEGFNLAVQEGAL